MQTGKRPLGRAPERLNSIIAAVVKAPPPIGSVVASLPLVALLSLSAPVAVAQPVSHVIHISIDGLRPDVITALGPTNLPNFYRLRAEGAHTDNARSDYDYTETLQNHTTQMTARGVLGVTGHNWTNNTDPLAGQTLATNKGSYVAGIYDVAHDNGLRTGHYASKTKFSLFDTSWNGVNGALDLIGPDNGRDKIDVYLYQSDTLVLENAMIASMTAQPFHYVFLHLRDPDTTGHASGWNVTSNSSAYCNTIKTMDSRLGQVFSLIDTNAQLHDRTAIILTADHGGTGTAHGDATLAANYTVPFYVWGPGVMADADLYLLNPGNRLNPGTSRPTYSAPVQPIRNGEAVNVALKLLQLGPVPGSTIGAAQDLALTVLPPADFRLAVAGGDLILSFSMSTNVLYDIQSAASLPPGGWSNVVTNLAGTNGAIASVAVGAAGDPARFYRLKLHF
jgi:hypothetical protein